MFGFFDQFTDKIVDKIHQLIVCLTVEIRNLRNWVNLLFLYVSSGFATSVKVTFFEKQSCFHAARDPWMVI